MTEFTPFAELVFAKFNEMAEQDLFTVDIDPDFLWAQYLAAYPPHTNPIFKTRTLHDCSCCRNFVKNLGNIRTASGETIWDVNPPAPFLTVAAHLSKLVKEAAITGIYSAQPGHYTFGSTTTYDRVNDVNWDHFHAQVPAKHRRTPTSIGSINTTYDVLKRGLEEIGILPNLDTVIDLIETNNLYRGTEHLAATKDFRALVHAYRASPDPLTFLWSNVNHRQARFRNTVIGTLVTDLCDGIDVERAVHSFEAKVAPANYKRPKSLITPKMIDDALATLDSLNLREALDRRMANFSDLSVNDVLFVDNDAAPLFRDGLKDLLLTQTKPAAPNTSSAIPITIDELLALKPTSLQLLVQNNHLGHFVTLTAPKHLDAPSPFRWNNAFAWSYDGNVTDSIKERVKKAGGNVDNAAMRVSLSWFNTDDLDLHVIEPSGNRICFYNKSYKLDVDMNAGWNPLKRDAVENVSWRPNQIADGVYKVIVNNYTRREAIDIGFDLEFVVNGEAQQFTYEQPVGGDIPALTFKILHGKLAELKTHTGIKASNRSIEKWGVTSQTFRKVQTLTTSPNHWADNPKPSGNKHWFFILEGCKNPDPVRGIYNEFLAPQFETHRKVFEVLGDKTKAEPTPDQLSGLGFSSTLNEEIFVQVNNAQTYKVKLA